MDYKKDGKDILLRQSDFALDDTLDCGQAFRWEKISDNAYHGAFLNKQLTISCENGSDLFRLHDTTEQDFLNIWKDYFDLDTDYGEIKRRFSSDETLAKACAFAGGIRILRQDSWESLSSFIISQNNNIPRIRKNIEALCDSYGERINDDFAAFPSPEALASAKEDDLAKLRLGYRSRYIIESSKQYLNDGPPSTREGLLSFCGIGPKVADCIMLFGLHQVAAFPIDTWVKHIMNDMYGFDEKDVKGMQRFADERFGELAGYAQQYLFYYYRDRG